MTSKSATAVSDRPRAASARSHDELAASLSKRGTMLLTTFKRDGTPVGTPVSVALDGGRIFFRSYTKAWKFKRLARNPLVEVTPSTLRGKPRGPTFAARARCLDGGDVRVARRALTRRHPVLQGVLVPAAHTLLRYTTVHYEITGTPHDPRRAAGGGGEHP